MSFQQTSRYKHLNSILGLLKKVKRNWEGTTQEEIDRLAKIDTGIITPKEALQQTFTLARSFAQS